MSTNRDSFYSKIIERLSGPLDHDVFEDCAADLLRSAHPGLAPVRGGDDAGMDGAIPDGERESYPLVTTTGQDVIGNLRRNLLSYAARGHQGRKAVLATSQALTPRKRENLEAAARSLGFVLVQIHDRSSFANLLYRDSRWCRELLGLTGDPCPLSVVPRSRRPILNTSLQGRETDLEWLGRTHGDKLLVGQPGSGKTFLLLNLVREGRALFAISRDRGELAAGIREQLPSLLIVDDVFPGDAVITDVLQLRESTGATFDVMATCWPSFESEVASTMQLPSASIHRLDLLTMDQMATTVHEANPLLSKWLVQEIVRQSQGLPGLAVTLTHLCSEGDARAVALGNALLKHVNLVLDRIVGRPVVDLMAVLSLAGDGGMSLRCLAAAAEDNEMSVRRALVDTAAAGVVNQVGGNLFRVRPERLRHALVRDVFFGGVPLAVDAYLQYVPSANHLALTLIGAKDCGAAVPDALLWPMVQGAANPRVMGEYAWLGPTEARRALRSTVPLPRDLARPALVHIPSEAIPVLLDQARGDDRPLHSYPEAPLRIIDDWVKEGLPGTGQPVARRKMLLDTETHWAAGDGDYRTAIRTLPTVLAPSFSTMEPEPGSGLKGTLTWGWLLPNEVNDIADLWPQAFSLIKAALATEWPPVLAAVEEWAHPTLADTPPNPELREVLRAGARQMVQDVASVAASHPAILRRAAETAADLDLALPVAIDADYSTLYPLESRRASWREHEREMVSAARLLGCSWTNAEPTAVARRLSWLEREAHLVDRPWPRLSPAACAALADCASACVPWARAFMKEGLPGDLVLPFIARAARTSESGWQAEVEAALADDEYQSSGIQATLWLAAPPAQLLEAVISRLGGFEGLVETMAVRGELSDTVLGQLLKAPPKIAAAVAQGEWGCDPEGSVRESIRADWRRAILHLEDDYWLSQIVGGDSERARDWLETHLADDQFPYWQYDKMLAAMANSLDCDAKGRILSSLPERYNVEIVVYYLLRSDAAAYEAFLKSGAHREYALLPLSGRPDADWIANALVALDSGYASLDVASAAFMAPTMLTTSWSGDESLLWAEWVEAFARLRAHSDTRLHGVAEIGVRIATERRERALAEERNEAVKGFR